MTYPYRYKPIVDGLDDFDWGRQPLRSGTTGPGRVRDSHNRRLFVVSRCPMSTALLARSLGCTASVTASATPKKLTKEVVDKVLTSHLKDECKRKKISISWIDLLDPAAAPCVAPMFVHCRWLRSTVLVILPIFIIIILVGVGVGGWGWGLGGGVGVDSSFSQAWT